MNPKLLHRWILQYLKSAPQYRDLAPLSVHAYVKLSGIGGQTTTRQLVRRTTTACHAVKKDPTAAANLAYVYGLKELIES